jgi:hypothetical protein
MVPSPAVARAMRAAVADSSTVKGAKGWRREPGCDDAMRSWAVWVMRDSVQPAFDISRFEVFKIFGPSGIEVPGLRGQLR